MKIHHHLFNENTVAGHPVGHWIFAGRWHLWFDRKDFFLEWNLLRKARSCALSIDWGHGDSDDGIMLQIAVPWLFQVFVGFDGILPKFIARGKPWDYWPRETGVKVHHGSVWVSFFAKTMSWSRGDPWYSKQLTLHVSDWILGRPKYTEDTDATSWRPIVVPMPEKSYRGQVRFFTSVWKRRFYTRRIRRCEVKMDEGVPFPGKGESSWDCGEDASHGMVCPASEMHEAIAEMVSHVMRRRCHYGNGINWLPQSVMLKKEA